MNTRLRVYSDGASRGNPGPSALAFLILSEEGVKLAENSRYVDVRTNNQAEYEALISALEFASELKSQEVSCYLDSELLVKQINGEYRVKNSKLFTLWLRVQELKQKFQKITFTYISRTDIHIQQVDQLVNQALDRVLG